jgi:hypothetical protein
VLLSGLAVAMVAVACGRPNLCTSQHVTCAGVLTCDPSDGVCKCGGAGGPVCGDGEACDLAAATCVSTRCAGVTCAAGTACDPSDGQCRCGGHGGAVCGAGERCDVAQRACVAASPCASVTCGANETCEPTSGTCRCGSATCSPTEVCEAPDGGEAHCIPNRCADVTCAAPTRCDPFTGACTCNGSVCRSSERCACPPGTDGGLCAESALSCAAAQLDGGPVLLLQPSPTLDFGRVAFFSTAPTVATRWLFATNAGTNPLGVDARGNLHLGGADGGTPLWRVTAANAATSASELCVGRFDAATQTCLGDLPAQGPGSYDPATGVPPSGSRASVPLPVQVIAASLGTKAWQLTVFSDDPAHPASTITVTAEVVSVPACALSLSPPNVAFGVVSPGQVRERQFLLRNASTTPGASCLVDGLQLTPGSDAAFELAPGTPTHRELQPQEQWLVTVRATAPATTGAPAQVTGALSLSVSNPQQPQRLVPLSATFALACLTVSPADVDFGTAQRGCSAAPRSLQIGNVCSGTVTIQSVTLTTAAGLPPSVSPTCPGTNPCPEFSILSNGGLVPNTVLFPGAAVPITMSLGYRPLDDGLDLGVLVITALQNGVSVDFVVSLHASANATGTNVEVLPHGGPPKADVLFVVDDSCSMYDKQQQLATNLGVFLAAATSAQSDFQIGVTTTDFDQGPPGRLLATPSGTKILRPTTPNVAQEFATLVNVGTAGSSTEACMEPALEAVTTRASDPSANLGFVRSDASLSVVCVTDATDQSPQAPTFYLNQLLALKGGAQAGRVAYNVIGPFGQPTASCSYDSSVDDGKHAFMVSQTNGVKAEICSPDWSTAMASIGQRAFEPNRALSLKATPVPADASGVSLTLNGMPLPAVDPTSGITTWTYDPLANAIVFTPYSVPPSADTLTATYQVACIP